MKIRVLGCSGGIGGAELLTTSLLVDQDILIDAGTGVGELSVDELALIDHVFITHSHLDHIACLPLMVDTVGEIRDRPLTVHGTAATLDSLRTHIFNWVIWPDFSKIPNASAPMMIFSEIELGRAVTIGDRKIVPLPANHTVPAVGYQLDSGQASLVFSGDTGPCPELWKTINTIKNLRYVIVECAFSNRDLKLAEASLHLCPQQLCRELGQFIGDAEIFITHLKPGQAERTMSEIAESSERFKPSMLLGNHVFEL